MTVGPVTTRMPPRSAASCQSSPSTTPPAKVASAQVTRAPSVTSRRITDLTEVISPNLSVSPPS